MPPAARILDQVSHTSALAALIAGAVLGAVIGAAVVATGGAAALVIASAAAAGASLGAGLGQFVGSFFSFPSGSITGVCSPNVIIGGRPAARATIDFSMCSGVPFTLIPHPNSLIAQGSMTVFINGFNAARETDKLICCASISSGCKSVIIGGDTTTLLPIDSEVPAWLEWGMFALGLVGGAGLLRLGFGLAWAGVGRVLGAGFLGGYSAGLAGGWLGGKIFGEGSNGQKIMGFVSSLVGGIIAGGLAFRGAQRSLVKITNPKDLVGFRKDHILNRHRFGSNKPNKTEFPKNWSDQRIINNVSEVAADPTSIRGVGKWDSPYVIGTRDGVKIRVDYYPNFKPNGQPHPNAGKISTAYPIK